MRYFDIFKKVLNPKGYVKSKGVGHKAVIARQKRKSMLKSAAGSGRPSKAPRRKVPIPRVVNQRRPKK